MSPTNPPNPDDEIWIFDAEGGCEECGAVAGEYRSKPKRPHPNCDCKIYKKDKDEDKFCQTKYSYTRRDMLGPFSIYEGVCWMHDNCLLYSIVAVIMIGTFDKVECCKIIDGRITNDCSEYDVLLKLTSHESQIGSSHIPLPVPIEV
jgi:hypothetical protein